MDELVAFLRAQLDEDERSGQARLRECLESNLEHDARFRLAEVEAKRRILDEWRKQIEHDDPAVYLAGPIIPMLLAQPYAGREGWQKEWQI
jgi:uncharacterized protein DUF6221